VLFVPGFQGLSDFRITISSEMVLSPLLLQDQEDLLHQSRLVQIRAVIGQGMDGSGNLFFGHGQPQAGEGSDQIVVLPLHWSGTLLHRFLLPFCVEEDRFAVNSDSTTNYLNALLHQGVVENGSVTCPLRSRENALFLELVVAGLADAQLLAEFLKGDEPTSSWS
jgi:hypothetical protein